MASNATMPTVVMSRACLLPACPASLDAQLTTSDQFELIQKWPIGI
jgi:hypothetical protein